MPLLNYYNQTKMSKGEAFGYKTAIMHLAPFKLSGKNVCPKATPGPGGCVDSCLNTSGRGQMKIVQKARLDKTNYFWKDRKNFLLELSKEIEILKRRARNQGFKFGVRLNGTSDISFHRFKIDNNKSVMELHPDVQFYDYTKVFNYLKHDINYHLTFSYSGKNLTECKKAIKEGYNVAVVFKSKLPKKYLGLKVIDGDKHDLRYLDKKGVIVGLLAKGVAKKTQSGGFING